MLGLALPLVDEMCNVYAYLGSVAFGTVLAHCLFLVASTAPWSSFFRAVWRWTFPGALPVLSFSAPSLVFLRGLFVPSCSFLFPVLLCL